MALPAKKVSLISVAVVVLLFSAASFSVYARSRSNAKIQSTWDYRVSAAPSFSAHARGRSYGKIQSTWEGRGHKNLFTLYLNFQRPRGGRKYQTFLVLLWEHPNGEAMDDKDARRRWYESFLPSILTDSGEPRLLHCCTFDVNGFLASLTRAEALVLADKPGVRSMSSNDLYSYSIASCGL